MRLYSCTSSNSRMKSSTSFRMAAQSVLQTFPDKWKRIALFQCYTVEVQREWGILGPKENFTKIWMWFSAYRASRSQQRHSMLSVVHAQFSLAASYRGNDPLSRYYLDIAQEEIEIMHSKFEYFVALILMVRRSPTLPL